MRFSKLDRRWNCAAARSKTQAVQSENYLHPSENLDNRMPDAPAKYSTCAHWESWHAYIFEYLAKLAGSAVSAITRYICRISIINIIEIAAENFTTSGLSTLNPRPYGPHCGSGASMLYLVFKLLHNLALHGHQPLHQDQTSSGASGGACWGC